MQKGLEKWTGIAAALVTIVGFPLLLGSLWFAFRLDTVISEQLGEIKRIAGRYLGKCSLIIRIRKNGKETIVRASPDYGITPSKPFINAIDRLLGKGNVKLQ